MIKINVENHQAQIQIDRQALVIVPLDSVPAAKVALSYTPLAWIWCAVNNALESAKIDLAFGDSYEIACRIFEKLSTRGSPITTKLVYKVLPFTEVT